MNRRLFMGAVAGGAVAAPLIASGQAPGKTTRVGYLSSASRAAMPISSSTFIDALRELGYVEGQNLVIDYRYANTQERLRELAIGLIEGGAQVIYAQNRYALRAARAATATLPIVGYDLETDPVSAGFADSLARPGGNVTGAFLDQAEISAKQLQILKEIVPGLQRVAVLWDAPLATPQHGAVELAGRKLGLTFSSIEWRGPEGLVDMLHQAAQSGAQGLVVLSSPRIHDLYRPLIADAALRNRLPAIGLPSNFAQSGLLVTYGPMQRDMYRSAAHLVAKILDGARPADLPIERPVRFALVDCQAAWTRNPPGAAAAR